MQLKPIMRNHGINEYKAIDVSMIDTKQEIRDLCNKKSCKHYGYNYMCPPAVKDIESWQTKISSYENGIILTKAYSIKNCFDLKGMFAGIKGFRETLGRINETLKSQYSDMDFLCLGAGPCHICKTCTIVENKPCRFPDKALPSIEACGINVMSLSKQAGVKYNNGKNTVTFLGLILYSPTRKNKGDRFI